MTKLGLEAEFFGVEATNYSVTASHIQKITSNIIFILVCNYVVVVVVFRKLRILALYESQITEWKICVHYILQDLYSFVLIDFLVFIGSNGCPRTNNVGFCGKTCSTDGDCRGNRKCLCDGDCGMICVKSNKCI